jgi:hypothetical protein
MYTKTKKEEEERRRRKKKKKEEEERKKWEVSVFVSPSCCENHNFLSRDNFVSRQDFLLDFLLSFFP